MAKLPVEIETKARQYVDVLNKHGFTVSAAYVFGSFAHGNWNESSDIDIAIVSAAFEGIRFTDRQKLNGLHSDIDLRISVMPFSIASFENSILHKEIVSTGVRVA